jgi:hypothetical protein
LRLISLKDHAHESFSFRLYFIGIDYNSRFTFKIGLNMPKHTTDPIRSITIGLSKADLEFINRLGIGENLSAKFRSVLALCAATTDKIAGLPDSLLVYEQTAEGEKLWKVPPFPWKKGAHWSKLAEAARGAGYVCEVIEDKEEGTVAVWVGKGKRLNDCADCKKRILECLPK